ncbi:RICIN domain-containing protein [uncultured Aquimarina sp.]|uniref:RICIN domain-containing protein n=1 Tax=uncultured Aquimarina sp. TaxID=575652 RepID=UPI00261FD9F4|nr:RICIN domain-containing protein [uncultured Aquimarina sp.]
MKTFCEKREVYHLHYLFRSLLVFMLVLTGVSCENEEFIDADDSLIKDEGLDTKATPVVGKIYTIKNLNNGRTLDIAGKSNNNGANLQVWGTDANTSGTHRQWEILSVGNGYVRFKGVDSGKSLEVAGGSNSNGANVQQWAYQGTTHQQWQIISVGNGYFRIKSRDSGKSLRVTGSSNGSNVDQYAYNGSNNQKWFFTEVGGTIDPPPPPPPGNTAAAIIGNGWKLNGFSGNLNVGSNDNGLNYADNASKAESHFFFEKDGFAAFRCYPGNPTSGGSSNPRSELREVINGGDNYWNGNTNTEHSMKWRFKIEDLPPSGKLAFGQIHERDDFYDDVIRVQVQGSSGQNSGSVDLRILGYVTEEIEGSGRTINFNMQMDTEYYFELTMRNGVVRLYNLNNNGNRIEELFESVDIGNANENYFKAGCYLQSTSSSHESSNVYGQVLIRDLVVSPDN